MKRIEDFTHDELLAMTNETIDRQVKIECAMDGVKMLPMPIKPEANIVNKNDFYFECAGLKSKTSAPLERIAAAIEKERQHLIKVDYTYKYGFSDYHVTGQNNDTFTVQRTACFLLADLENRASQLANQKEEKERYDAHKSLYDKEQKNVDLIRSNITAFVWNAREKQAEINSMKRTFQEYVGLTYGNEDKALVFFDKAYPDLNRDIRVSVVGHLLDRAATPEEARSWT